MTDTLKSLHEAYQQEKMTSPTGAATAAYITALEDELVKARPALAAAQRLAAASESFAEWAAEHVDDEGWAGGEQKQSIVTWFGPSDFREIRDAYEACPPLLKPETPAHGDDSLLVQFFHERMERNEDGSLDEIVTQGGTHLEWLDEDRWFLSCERLDGSAHYIWFQGKIIETEECAPSDSPRRSQPVVINADTMAKVIDYTANIGLEKDGDHLVVVDFNAAEPEIGNGGDLLCPVPHGTRERDVLLREQAKVAMKMLAEGKR